MPAMTIQNRQGDRLEIWADPTNGRLVIDAITATDAWCIVSVQGANGSGRQPRRRIAAGASAAGPLRRPRDRARLTRLALEAPAR